MNDLVILVGGRGKRLGKVTKHTPKPLVKIKNNIPKRPLINPSRVKPLLGIILWSCAKTKLFAIMKNKVVKIIFFLHAADPPQKR